MAAGTRARSSSRRRPARARRSRRWSSRRRSCARAAIKRVAVVCPTSPLTRQWARAAAARRPAPAARRARPAPARRLPGRRAHVRPRGGRRRRVREDLLARHARHRRRGAPPRRGPRVGRGLQARVRSAQAVDAAVRARRSAPTTPRSRASRYDGGECVPDVSYGYADAVRDGVCRPVTFVPYDGTLQWQSGDDVIETSFDEVLTDARGGAPLPDGDLDRAARRPAADPARRAPASSSRSAPSGHLRRRRARRHRGLRPRARGRQGAARDHRHAADGRAPHRGQRAPQARRVPQDRASRGSSR